MAGVGLPVIHMGTTNDLQNSSSSALKSVAVHYGETGGVPGSWKINNLTDDLIVSLSKIV